MGINKKIKQLAKANPNLYFFGNLVDSDIEFGFLDSFRKGKRYSKWAKSTAGDEVNVIAEYYDISPLKAKDVLKVLTEEQKVEIIQIMKEKANV